MQIIQDRRALHRIPELGQELPKTRVYVENALSGLNCQVFWPTEHDICAFFDFGADHALAFRADMDALPILENPDCPFRSCHEGQMHACGHDGHTAILLELARRLSERKDLKHNVLLLFQSAEETVGGARFLSDSGVLEQYSTRAVFGLHLWPGLEKGVIHTRPGVLMARSAEVTATVTGRASHIAKPEEGADALNAVFRFYEAARALEKKYFEPGEGLLNFGKLTAGQARNAIADRAELAGTLRCTREETFHALRADLEAEAQRSSQSGIAVSLHFSDGYPPVWNHPQVLKQVSRFVRLRLLEHASMTSEDFSFYQRRVPGVFFFLGLGDTPPLHSPDFGFDEAVLTQGADFFQQIAEVLP